ncbi:hypothetical protein IWX64_001712 [Arthrobacter sp. CAN_A212]
MAIAFAREGVDVALPYLPEEEADADADADADEIVRLTSK